MQIAINATKKIKGNDQALKMPTVWGDRHLRVIVKPGVMCLDGRCKGLTGWWRGDFLKRRQLKLNLKLATWRRKNNHSDPSTDVSEDVRLRGKEGTELVLSQG